MNSNYGYSLSRDAGEVAALDVYIKLMRVADSVTARLEPVMASAGLTVGQVGTLEALLHLGGKETGNGAVCDAVRLARAL